MPLDPKFLSFLRCPETLQPLREASSSLIQQVNCEGWLPQGAPALSEALVREDGEMLYPVRGGIPILLLDEAVRIPPAG